MTFREWKANHWKQPEPKFTVEPGMLEVYEAIAEIAYNAALEQAAKISEGQHVGKSIEDECDNGDDRAYNQALRDAAIAIRERIENVPVKLTAEPLINYELLGDSHPLAFLDGKYKDDPAWDQYMKEVEEYRQEVNARERVEK